MVGLHHPTSNDMTPGTLHPPTLRAPPYTHARCNQRIPAVSDATNVCHQRMPPTYPYNISPQRMSTTYPCNISLQYMSTTYYPSYISIIHIPNTYPQYISPPHNPHHTHLWTFLVTYGKLWLVLVNNGESW